jgi:hypothetical protein
MPSVSQVTGRQQVTVLKIEDVDPINITFYPDRITLGMMRQWFQIQAMPMLDANLLNTEESVERLLISRLDSMADTLAGLIAAWNMTEDDGSSMVALTPERLRALGFPFLSRVYGHIFRVVQLGEKKGTISKTHSNGTSVRKAR